MSITLHKLCRDTQAKYDLKLIAGKGGMNNTVRWVHMVEDRQVPEFLHGNELVFTTGIGHLSKDSLLEFIKKLRRYGAAGLVINIGPYLTDVPSEVIDYCEKENFPLFTLPWQVYIIDITYDFCHRIIENEKLETSAAQAFQSLIHSPDQPELYVATLEQQGYSKVTDYVVFALEFFRGGKNVTKSIEQSNHIRLWNLLAKSKHYPAAMFVMEDKLVVIRQDSPAEQIAQITQAMARLFAEVETTYVMGISTTRRGYHKVPKLYDEACAAMRDAGIRGKESVYYRDMGVNKLLFGVENREILTDFADQNIKDILDYDQKYHTDYAQVLYAYLKCDGSIKAVADQYGVHRNTVNSKIKAIKSIFDIELTGEKKTELMLAFLILDITGRPNS